jgi:ubiquinone/menaquinone biosynthesis C-methylase UbiE
MTDGAQGDDREILAAQVDYYRAVATEYLDGRLDEPGADELAAAVREHAPQGSVLELACGPGTWTQVLLHRATRVTAVDAAPEMLDLARARVGADERVRFVRADLFEWEPDGRYDAVFMGFWLSHVPWSRFAEFWRFVDRCLIPGGRVLVVDDAFRTEAELVEGAASTTVERRLRDGTAHRAVKVPHEPGHLQRELRRLGWDVTVHPTRGPFYWGEGGRTAGALRPSP